jgi:hypothetical protein
MGTNIKWRAGQRELMRRLEDYRMLGFIARRQYGKTTLFAGLALMAMMRHPGLLVTYGSATLLLGRELIMRESRILREAVAAIAGSGPDGVRVDVIDGGTGKRPDKLGEDDFAGLFESQRLEFRLWHDRTIYSRTQVIAPNPSTAVGWTGWVMLDEVGRLRDFRGVWEAVEPIASSDPSFRLLLCTTPPPDDNHFSFEMLGPPVGTTFTPKAEGSWYKSEMGVNVLRVSAYDAWADGIAVYDLDTGEPLGPDEHRRRAQDREAWDRNYGCQFTLGGTAACGLLLLDTAQRRGMGQCKFIWLDAEDSLADVVDWLHAHLGGGRVGLGWDLATTEGEKSNPSSVWILEETDLGYAVRCIVAWKTADPDIAERRVGQLLTGVADRAAGGRAKRLVIDGSNERYFATAMKKRFSREVPVEIVCGGDKAPLHGAGNGVAGDGQNMKQYLGAMLVGALEDNWMALPPERYVRDDFRRVRRERGTFVAEVGPEGQHADTFDGTKLGLWGLVGGSGDAIGLEELAHIRIGRSELETGI